MARGRALPPAVLRQRQGIAQKKPKREANGARAVDQGSIARMFGGATRPAADPTRKPRRQDRRWQKIQAEQLEREPFCRICAAAGKQVQAVEVDHILALADGGSFDDPANLQSLCRRCHYQKTATRTPGAPDGGRAKVRLRAPVDPATGLPLPGYGHW